MEEEDGAGLGGGAGVEEQSRHRPRRGVDSITAYVTCEDAVLAAGPPAPGGALADLPLLMPGRPYARFVLPPSVNVATPTDNLLTRLERTARNHVKSPVQAVAFQPDGRRVITGSSVGEFTVWSGTHFNFDFVSKDSHNRPINCMRFLPSGEYLLSADAGGAIKYWTAGLAEEHLITTDEEDAAKRHIAVCRDAHAKSVHGLTFAPGQRKFASCSVDGTVKVWDFYRHSVDATLAGHGSAVMSVSWHPHWAVLASGGGDPSRGGDTNVRLWDVAGGREVRALAWHAGRVQKVAFSPINPHWLLSGAFDNTVRLTDLRMAREPLATFSVDHTGVTALQWHPFTERLFVTGSNDGAVQWWVEGKAYPHAEVARAHQEAVWDLAWSPCGGTLVTVSNDYNTKFWARARPGDEALQYAYQGDSSRGKLAGGNSNTVPVPGGGGAPVVVPGAGGRPPPPPPTPGGPSFVGARGGEGDEGGAPAKRLPPPGYVCRRCNKTFADPKDPENHFIEECPLAIAAKLCAEYRAAGKPIPASLLAFEAQARPPPGYVCKKCGIPGHFIQSCTAPAIRPAAGAGGKPGANYVCHICGVGADHYIQDCPQKPRGGGGGAGGRGGGRGGAVGGRGY